MAQTARFSVFFQILIQLIYQLELPLSIILEKVCIRATNSTPCCSAIAYLCPYCFIPSQFKWNITGRAGELVTVDDGVSQGSPEGTPFVITAIHGFVNEALHAHPNTTQQFVSLILDNLAQYFDLKLKISKTQVLIRMLHWDPMNWMRWPKYQLRDPQGLGFPATAPTLVPAFHAASLRHLVDIVPH